MAARSLAFSQHLCTSKASVSAKRSVQPRAVTRSVQQPRTVVVNAGKFDKLIAAAKNVAAPMLAANLLLVDPSEAGKLFDLNATAPLVGAQFVLLMFLNDKMVFGPVGAKIDERDALIRNTIQEVKDAEVAKEEAEQEAATQRKDQLSAAKSKLAAVKAECDKEAEEEVKKAQVKLDSELAVALAAIQKAKEGAEGNTDASVKELAKVIVDRVWPSDEELKSMSAALKEADSKVSVPVA